MVDHLPLDDVDDLPDCILFVQRGEPHTDRVILFPLSLQEMIEV